MEDIVPKNMVNKQVRYLTLKIGQHSAALSPPQILQNTNKFLEEFNAHF
jgi:hypothetical protein